MRPRTPQASPLTAATTRTNAGPAALPGADADAAARRARRYRWLVRASALTLCVSYVVLWALIGLIPLNPTDLDVFFLPSARIALGGRPLFVYELRYAVVYPNANGPLSLLPLTAAAALARTLGWLDNPTLRRMVIQAVFAVFPLLVSWEALRAADRLLPRPVPLPWRAPLAALFALSPALFETMLLYGHVEHALMIWLVLLAVRLLASRRNAWAGAALGLALLTRSSAVVYVLPLALLLLRHRRWRGSALLLGVAGGVVGLGLLPFYLADRTDLLYSLTSFHALLPVGGGSLWGLAINTPLEGLAARYDTWVVLGVVALLTTGALALRRAMDVDSADVYMLLGLTGCCFALFIKTLWPYYFYEEYVFVAIWWLTQAGRAVVARGIWDGWRRWGRWLLWGLGAALPLGAVGLTELVDYGVSLRLRADDLPTWSLRTAGVTLLFTGVLVLAWAAAPQGSAHVADPDAVEAQQAALRSGAL